MPTLILASIDDINTHLPTDKLDAGSNVPVIDNAISLHSIDVSRLILGYLSGVYTPTTLASWSSPGATPDYLRAIAGRLIAAFLYAQRYSEDIEGENKYAQSLYTEAMSMLEQVRFGEVILPTPIPEAGTQFSEAFFAPNTQSTPPKFSMDTVFG